MYSLKYKILLLTLTPLLLVLLAIGFLAIDSKSGDERKLLLERLNSFRSLLESGDITFETVTNKAKLRALLGGEIEFSEIFSTDYSLLYSSENLATPLTTRGEEEKAIHEAFQGIETIKNNYVSMNGKSLFVLISPLVVNNRVVAVLYQGISNVDSNQRIKEYAFYILILISSGILICFVSIYILLDKIILKNIHKLKNTTLEIRKGNLNIRSDVVSRDEIGELSTTFNLMTENLQGLYNSMDEKVKEKTKELSAQMEKVENSKKAVMNLLEDIQKEKGKVEGIVVERTKELNSEKARLLASINSLSFGFIIADIEHNVLLKNKAMLDLFGLKDTDVISINHVEELLGENFNIKTQIELCLKDKKVCEIKEIVFGAKFLRGIIAPVVTEEAMIGYVFLLEDVTEARNIDKTKTEFVSLASHQLRTPLSAINWYTEMLLSGDAGELNPEQHNFLEEVITSSKRMSSLVGTLLDVSRIELGTFAVNPESVDLCQLIEDEVEDLKLQIAEKKIIFKLLFNLKPALVKVDPKLMSIAIQNFLTNAIKYTSVGGKVSVLVDGDKKLGGVIVSVTDDGFGILKEDQSKIFTKMYRADNAKASDATGNGLGLYMVKSILESSGCKVWFESPPKDQKQGTVFYVHIPKEGMKVIKAAKRLGGPMS